MSFIFPLFILQRLSYTATHLHSVSLHLGSWRLCTLLVPSSASGKHPAVSVGRVVGWLNGRNYGYI